MAQDYDVVVVGASIGGCTAATLLGRGGARVALVERKPDPAAFKRICSHFIQASAVPTLERLGLMEAIAAAGGVRSRGRIRGPWGWILPVDGAGPASVNLRRERLDPLLRSTAAATSGVELLSGLAADELLRDGDRVAGVVARSRDGRRRPLRTRLVVGADGRDSRIAALAAVPTRTTRHERIAYAAYFEGPPPAGAPDASLWLLDPDWAAAFPTDSGLTMYAAMPTKARRAEFRADPGAALAAYMAALPDAPPIGAARAASQVMGKLEMPNVSRRAAGPGLALVGDAALAADPLWGVGCGWALQSAEWLADSVAPALAGAEPLDRGLARYRRRHARRLRGHARMIEDYATGRPLNGGERAVFSAATTDRRIAALMESYGTRSIGPARALGEALPRALAVHARRRLLRRPAAPIASAA